MVIQLRGRRLDGLALKHHPCTLVPAVPVPACQVEAGVGSRVLP